MPAIVHHCYEKGWPELPPHADVCRDVILLSTLLQDPQWPLLCTTCLKRESRQPSVQEGFGQGSMVYPAHLHGKYC